MPKVPSSMPFLWPPELKPRFLQEVPLQGSSRTQVFPVPALKNIGLWNQLFQISEVSLRTWKNITKSLSFSPKHLKSNLSVSLPDSPKEPALKYQQSRVSKRALPENWQRSIGLNYQSQNSAVNCSPFENYIYKNHHWGTKLCDLQILLLLSFLLVLTTETKNGI